MLKKKKFLTLLLTKESAEHVEDFNTSLELFIFLLRYSFLLTDTPSKHNFFKRHFPNHGELSTPKRNGARYLDPKYSRWLSTDPALGEYVPAAGKGNANDAGNLPGMGGIYNSVNGNLYHYAGNNPVKYVDPDGRIDWEKVGNQALEELKRTFNGDFGADFFYLSMQEYNNGNYLSGLGHSLDGTAELIFDLLGIYKLAQGIDFLVDKIGSAFSTSSLSSKATTATTVTDKISAEVV